MAESPAVPDQDSTLAVAARWVVILCGGWYLLKELGGLLQPLLLAVLTAYIVIPAHLYVKRYVPGRWSIVAFVLLLVLAAVLLSEFVRSNLTEFRRYLPEYAQRVTTWTEDLQAYLEDRRPGLAKKLDELKEAERRGEGHLNDLASKSVTILADTAGTGLMVLLYLLFLLMEAGRFPDRVRKAFGESRSTGIMDTVHGINQGIAHYLTAKVKSSLALAIPVWVILTVFGAKFAVLWGLVVFLSNFIPYIGTVIGFGFPAVFALLQFGPGWETITICVLMLATHIIAASIVEPAILGKAVGVSPVVILLSLAFWGSCWGIIGMLLAVPLTVIAKISCGHIAITRPLARLASDE